MDFADISWEKYGDSNSDIKISWCEKKIIAPKKWSEHTPLKEVYTLHTFLKYFSMFSSCIVAKHVA
jgi:hypothetical protein